MDRPSPLIETEALTCRFGSMVAVDSVDMSVAAGEVFGLVGRNGAGKSTLIKMLLTLLAPSSGRARLRASTWCARRDRCARRSATCRRCSRRTDR